MNKIYNLENNSINWDEVLTIPEFKALTETPQNILWHKEGNAFIHTKMVTEAMINATSNHEKFYDKYREILIISALLHDIGKPVTTKLGEDNLYHCKNHAIEGAIIAKNILEKHFHELNKQQKEAIISLVENHMQPLYILNTKNPKNTLIKIINKLKHISFEDLLLLKKCDCIGSITDQENDYMSILDSLRTLYYTECTYRPGTVVKIKKIGETKSCKYPHNNHPNGIDIGYTNIGNLMIPIAVGSSAVLGSYIQITFLSSTITKIIDKNHFETLNSVYEITEFFNKK